MSAALPPEAEGLIGMLVGAWADVPVAIAAPSIPTDPLHAVAVACPIDPTGAGVLDGQTIVVKDNVAVAGVPMAVGSGAPGFLPSRDATIVARMRAAGGRIVAKAQCEAFLLGANSFSSRPEWVRNPYDRRRSAGGSSSGSAALVAARRADLAIGTDSGGSIRIPAAFCGIVGFKPTRGRVPCSGATLMEPTLSHAGPLARSVAGVAALFSVLDGPDGLDPRQVWSRCEDGARTEASTGLRVGVIDTAMTIADRPIAAVIDAALGRVEAAGARRISVDWPDREGAIEVHLALYLAGQALAADPARSSPFVLTEPDGWAQWRADMPDDVVPPELTMEIAIGRALLGRDPGLYARALRQAQAIGDRLDALFDDVDVLALPTVATPPPLHPDGPISSELYYGDTRMTAAFNATGHPALSLPAGLSDGLPVGLQLVARRGADAVLLAAAARIEAALDVIPPPVGDFGDPL